MRSANATSVLCRPHKLATYFWSCLLTPKKTGLTKVFFADDDDVDNDDDDDDHSFQNFVSKFLRKHFSWKQQRRRRRRRRRWRRSFIGNLHFESEDDLLFVGRWRLTNVFRRRRRRRRRPRSPRRQISKIILSRSVGATETGVIVPQTKKNVPPTKFEINHKLWGCYLGERLLALGRLRALRNAF